MASYYNENDSFAAAWLRELIKAKVIADGKVDERSIEEVQPKDLRGFTQCHFFAGIGVWSYALRLAGWPDDRPVWTGSCPCPSFSAAGQGKGFDDPRHLWPAWSRLIRECHPATVFGEQVDDAIGHGWLDLVQTDMERENYAVGKAVFGACSVGAPHERQRLYFVAQSENSEVFSRPCKIQTRTRAHQSNGPGDSGTNVRGLSNTSLWGDERSRTQRDERYFQNSPWQDYEWIESSYGWKFPLKPGLRLLADGVAGRVGLLRGYGNALVAPQAQAFIEAYLGIDVAPVTSVR